MNRRNMLAGGLLGFLGAAGEGLAQQSYPERPLRLVVPYSPGQGADISARAFADILRRILGQPVVADNRPGAGGNIGATAVARAAADGYTLLWGSNATHVANEFLYASMPFDPVRDFTPIAPLVITGMVLSVMPNFEAKSLPDVVRLARARPGSLAVAVPSTTARIALDVFSRAAEIDLLSVPFTANAPALTALLRGDVQLLFDTLTASVGPATDGQIIPIGVSLETRAASLANVPTFGEMGYDVVIAPWNGLYGPRDTPAGIVATLNAATNRVLEEPGFQRVVASSGSIVLGGSPEALATLMRRDREKLGPVIRGLGLTVQ